MRRNIYITVLLVIILPFCGCANRVEPENGWYYRAYGSASETHWKELPSSIDRARIVSSFDAAEMASGIANPAGNLFDLALFQGGDIMDVYTVTADMKIFWEGGVMREIRDETFIRSIWLEANNAQR